MPAGCVRHGDCTSTVFATGQPLAPLGLPTCARANASRVPRIAVALSQKIGEFPWFGGPAQRVSEGLGLVPNVQAANFANKPRGRFSCARKDPAAPGWAARNAAPRLLEVRHH